MNGKWFGVGPGTPIWGTPHPDSQEVCDVPGTTHPNSQGIWGLPGTPHPDSQEVWGLPTTPPPASHVGVAQYGES